MAKRPASVSGIGVMFGATAIYLVYAGIRDVEPIAGLRDLMQGRKPAERGGGAYDPVKLEAASRAAAAIGQAAADVLTSGRCGQTSPNDIVTAPFSRIRVHKSIVANTDALVMAARGAGIRLGGGGYRDPAAQMRLRRQNCPDPINSPSSACSPPTAPVGSSMHQCGLAIDFTHNGASIRSGSAAHRWLQANAGRFGFKPLASEPWHWSTNGN